MVNIRTIEYCIYLQKNGDYYVLLTAKFPEFPKAIPFFSGVFRDLEKAREARNVALIKREKMFPGGKGRKKLIQCLGLQDV